MLAQHSPPLDEHHQMIVDHENLRAYKALEPHTGLYKYTSWAKFPTVSMHALFQMNWDVSVRASWDPHCGEAKVGPPGGPP